MKGSYDHGLDSDGVFELAPNLVSAAHELKSPLALIRQLTLGLETDTQLGPSTRESLERIRLTSERALRLTSDMTRHARLEDSLFELEPLNPQALCEEIVYELQPLYSAHAKQLTVASRQRAPLVVANRELLRRILLNLTDNALHYSDGERAVKLQIVSRGRSTVRVSVRDYGPALPADIWKTISSGLGQHPQPLHSRPASSGLGLLVAGQFAEAMQAKLGATRHRDGASFYVDLTASTQLSLL